LLLSKHFLKVQYLLHLFFILLLHRFHHRLTAELKIAMLVPSKKFQHLQILALKLQRHKFISQSFFVRSDLLNFVTFLKQHLAQEVSAIAKVTNGAS
jgi:hypothetical protein